MAIKTRASIQDKQLAAMELTISFTMPVKDWRELSSKQGRAYPNWDLAMKIDAVLDDLGRSTAFNVEDESS